MSDGPALAVHRPDGPPAPADDPPGLRLDVGLYVGPLDLLHHLARRSEVDVRELELAEVARQFDRYAKALAVLDLDGAGDFLTAASHLLEMKSKRVLPAPPKRQKVERSADRTELLARLLEYRRYKEAAGELERRAAGCAERLPRVAPRPERDGNGVDRIRDVELWDLVGALARVLEPAEEVGAGTLKREDVPVAKWVETPRRPRAEGGPGAVRDLFRGPGGPVRRRRGVSGGAGTAEAPRVPGDTGRRGRADRDRTAGGWGVGPAVPAVSRVRYWPDVPRSFTSHPAGGAGPTESPPCPSSRSSASSPPAGTSPRRSTPSRPG